MIEIQQSLNPIDVFRFRSYIAKHYSAHENIIKKEKIVVKNDKVTVKEQLHTGATYQTGNIRKLGQLQQTVETVESV